MKPPKSGNCTIIDDSPLTPLISISNLKNIYHSVKSKLLQNLKIKLNTIIEQKEWEFNDIVEHNYAKAEVVDCLIYYLTGKYNCPNPYPNPLKISIYACTYIFLFTGYLLKQLLKYTKDCDSCKSSFVVSEVYSQQLPATLVNLKTRGGLIHPNIHFFNFIKKIEESFSQNNSSANVFDLIDDLMKMKPLSFPCAIHVEQIIAYTVMYYVRMRMRQFSFQKNRKQIKANRNKKKFAKFCKTY